MLNQYKANVYSIIYATFWKQKIPLYALYPVNVTLKSTVQQLVKFIHKSLTFHRTVMHIIKLNLFPVPVRYR